MRRDRSTGPAIAASFRAITLPLLMPTMFVVLVLSLIRAVQVFDQVFVLTGGGPGTATQYMVQYIYDTGFANQIQRFGLAAAASVLLGVTLWIFTMIQLRLGRGQTSPDSATYGIAKGLRTRANHVNHW